jgi:hypothetical protein
MSYLQPLIKSYQAKAFRSGAAGMAAKRMGTMSAKDAYDNEKKRHAGIELSKSLQRRDARKNRNEEVQEERTAHHIAEKNVFAMMLSMKYFHN